MRKKTYIITLDIDKYGWTHLWNHTIGQISKLAIKVEVIATLIPTLAVTTTGEDIDILQTIEGIKNIEEDEVGYLTNN